MMRSTAPSSTRLANWSKDLPRPAARDSRVRDVGQAAATWVQISCHAILLQLPCQPRTLREFLLSAYEPSTQRSVYVLWLACCCTQCIYQSCQSWTGT